jgi:CheY-like chemotaxis protein
MPRLDGYRLCHEVRKNPALQHLRFILYSSTYTSPTDVRLCDTVGADQFIAKPAPVANIVAALTIATGQPAARPSVLPGDAAVLEQYSAVLVRKLEEKNAELQHALAEAQRAHARVTELNEVLENRVRERTADLARTNEELTVALAEVKQLSKLIPICSYCRNIRDGKDYWDCVEGYVTRHTDSKFSHSICPTCYEKHVAPMLKDLGIDEVPPAAGVPVGSAVPRCGPKEIA